MVPLVRDRHRYFLPALERQARSVKGQWLEHLRGTQRLLTRRALMGPQHGVLGRDLAALAHLMTQEEASLSSIQICDDAVRMGWPHLELQPWHRTGGGD